MNWISVKDRLPELNSTVLVLNKSGFMYTAWFEVIELYDYSNDIKITRENRFVQNTAGTDCPCTIIIENVTNWIYVNDLPKPECNNELDKHNR